METKYPLEERTLIFGKDVVRLCRKLKQDAINRPIIVQLVRSATSVGANYKEANGASSRKDFRNKIYIAKKEALETQYWLEMLSEGNENQTKEIESLKQESLELGKILSKIIGTLNKKEFNK